MVDEKRMELLVSELEKLKDHLPEMIQLSPEEVVEIVNKDGGDFTIEEVAAFGKEVVNNFLAKDGELSEEDLENVAGGGKKPGWVKAGEVLFAASEFTAVAICAFCIATCTW